MLKMDLVFTVKRNPYTLPGVRLKLLHNKIQLSYLRCLDTAHHMKQLKTALLKRWTYDFLFCDFVTFACFAEDFLTFGFGVTL
jgi:hypothetical protein